MLGRKTALCMLEGIKVPVKNLASTTDPENV
jgi:hypothetical protein